MKKWWRITSAQTKLFSTLPWIPVIALWVYCFKGLKDDYPDMATIGWVLAGLFTAAFLTTSIWMHFSDYKNNK